MSTTKQLRLFPSARPLSERLGKAFFRSLPKTPGVYLMFDGRGRLLYVGKSVNLRQRVGSYRHISPERSSRKLVRLVHAVDRIEWEQCATDVDAQLRENVLLRERRPKFNSMNTWPKAHCFVGVEWNERTVTFSFTRQVPQNPEAFHGAFKSGCLAGYISLLRLLWTALFRPVLPQDYPRPLLSEKPPKEFSVELDERSDELVMRACVSAFFDGESPLLIDWMKANVAMETLSLFHRNLLTEDFARVQDFYSRGPLRNTTLRRQHALHEQLIGQELLDDLLVKNRFAS